MASDELSRAIRDRVTERDVDANASLQSIPTLEPHLEALHRDRGNVGTIIDLGCGYGGLTTALGDLLGARRLVGVDTDEGKLARASDRGLETAVIDLEAEVLPLDDGEADLVLAFGLLEHMRYADHVLAESHRVLRDGGWLWLTVPNLGSWLNRLSLLLGYQPRNVELSTERAVGMLPGHYDGFIDHVHAPTHRALGELLVHHGFEVVDEAGLSPYQDSRIVRGCDRAFARRPSLARRIGMLARVPGSV